MFYTFSQNNSFGRYDFDQKQGITKFVIVEADNHETANLLAETIGLYFRGCANGTDCHCCGDRWNEQWDNNDGTLKPEIYGQVLIKGYDYREDNYKRMPNGREACVHYLNGERSWH